MQVICTDGTTFACEGFELTEYGVALYGQNLAQEKERYDSEPEQTGYIPHDRLWYVLPDGVTPNVPAPLAAQGQPGQRPPMGNDQSPPGQPQGAVPQPQQKPGQQRQPPEQQQPEQR